MTSNVFNIQKFCVNDGPGIRTTVFIKGCPLNCLWCHNPESKNLKSELLFRSDKCTLCGRCVPACPLGLHTVSAEGHIFDREKCVACGKCAEACFADALEIAGKKTSVEDVLKEVMKDEAFYKNSGGGMTLSGGEPMLNFDFTLELLKQGKEKGLHICMETCGFADSEKYKAVAPYVDIFLWDYKLTSPELHKKYTGVDNGLILIIFNRSVSVISPILMILGSVILCHGSFRKDLFRYFINNAHSHNNVSECCVIAVKAVSCVRIADKELAGRRIRFIRASH